MVGIVDTLTLNNLEAEMRLFMMVVAAVLLLSGPAYSQKPRMNLNQAPPVDKKLEQYRKDIESEHNAALKRIPERKPKNTDPWLNLRSCPDRTRNDC